VIPTRPNDAVIEAWNTAYADDWIAQQPVLDAFMSDVARLLLAAAAPQRGESVLDIGCGTGATSLAAAGSVGADGRVVGLDVSAPLLDHAARRAEAVALENVSFLEADAQVHPFAADFDVVISRFGVMFFDDPPAAFANIARALRPGGRIALATWSTDTAWFVHMVDAVTRRLGPVPPPDPSLPGPMSLSDPDRLAHLLRQAGLADVACRTVDTVLTPPGGIAGAVALSHATGPIQRLLRERGGTDADRAAIDAAFSDSLRPYLSGGELRVPARINLATARRPGVTVS
jgi:SAM-dependent methyltransferase